MLETNFTADPIPIRLDDDDTFPNSVLPVLIYRCEAGLRAQDMALKFERRFLTNGWTNSWRDGVYFFAHFHSTTHEVLGVARGTASLQLGGPEKGADISVKRGDVLVIPAGVAHRQLDASDDFLVVGAYPGGRDWDVLRGNAGDRPAADRRIADLPLPLTDPLHGPDGPLLSIWREASKKQNHCSFRE